MSPSPQSLHLKNFDRFLFGSVCVRHCLKHRFLWSTWFHLWSDHPTLCISLMQRIWLLPTLVDVAVSYSNIFKMQTWGNKFKITRRCTKIICRDCKCRFWAKTNFWDNRSYNSTQNNHWSCICQGQRLCRWWP